MNQKGFVFTLDVGIGISIVFLVILVSLFFILKGNEVSITEHQLLRVGSDIVTILDRQNAFDSLEYTTIETKLQEILPSNYGMLLRLQGNFSQGNGTIEVGDEIPVQDFILAGRRAALTEDDIYLTITYWIWTREP